VVRQDAATSAEVVDETSRAVSADSKSTASRVHAG